MRDRIKGMQLSINKGKTLSSQRGNQCEAVSKRQHRYPQWRFYYVGALGVFLLLGIVRPSLPPPQEWQPAPHDMPIIAPIAGPSDGDYSIKEDKPKKPKKHPKRQPLCLHPELFLPAPDAPCLPERP